MFVLPFKRMIIAGAVASGIKEGHQTSGGLSSGRYPRPSAREARLIISTTGSQSASLIHVKICHSLVPAAANACVPICTPAGVVVIDGYLHEQTAPLGDRCS